MNLSKSSFKDLESKIIATLDGRRVLDVPYYRYIYPPEKEKLCIDLFENFCDILKRKKYSAETVYISEILVEALKNLGFLSESLLKVEEQNLKEIEENLEDVLAKEVIGILKDRLNDKDISHCAIILRIGSIFPFIHVSELLSKMEGYIKCTIIIPYPGSKEGEMLNYRGDRNYYRGEIIGDKSDAN